jgi:hypothetical protein
MVEKGEIGSLADESYSFMGATDHAARREAGIMRAGDVNAVLLVPV